MTLVDLLRPLTVNQFLLHHFGSRPLHVTGDPERLATLASDRREDAWRLLERDLERVLDARVEMIPGAPALPHEAARAARDTILLLLAGTAQIRLWDREAGEPADGGRIQELSAGDWLYVPRDTWLAGEVPGGAALSVTVANPTGHDLMAWLMRQITQHEFFARDLPRFAAPGEQADYLTEFRRTIVRMCRTPGLFLLYSSYASGVAPPRPPLRPPAPSGTTIDYLARHALRLWRTDAENIAVHFDGRTLALPVETAELLAFLEDRAPVSFETFVSTFAQDFDREELEELMGVLTREGLTAMIDGGEHG